jgi:very-short-patch-repair endonuclease
VKYAGDTGSVAEAVFWSSLMQTRTGMPCPVEVQYPLVLEGQRVYPDFAWPVGKIIVEIDGRDYHTSAKSFTRDRQKDRLYLRAGWTCIRFSASEVLGTGGAEMCVEELFATLGWSYPDELLPAPDADLLHPSPAPEIVKSREYPTEIPKESVVNVRKRIWCT